MVHKVLEDIKSLGIVLRINLYVGKIVVVVPFNGLFVVGGSSILQGHRV